MYNVSKGHINRMINGGLKDLIRVNKLFHIGPELPHMHSMYQVYVRQRSGH